MDFSITKNGKALDPNLYNWDENTRTLSTNESDLVLDFSDIDNCTFKTKYNCTLKTGSACTFDTGYDCTFDTGSYCVFNTGGGCTFDTENECTFKTGGDCEFRTGNNCTFNIWNNYKKIKHGKGCVAIIRTGDNKKITDFDDNKSVRFLKET